MVHQLLRLNIRKPSREPVRIPAFLEQSPATVVLAPFELQLRITPARRLPTAWVLNTSELTEKPRSFLSTSMVYRSIFTNSEESNSMESRYNR